MASSYLFATLRYAVEDVARLRFERQASDAKAVIEGRIHSYSDVLYGLKALFGTHASVTRLQFHRFVQALELKRRFPGFDVVSFAAYVPAAAVGSFVATVRSDTSLQPAGYPHFSISPPGARSEYFVVAYLEPMAGHEFAFGRDLAANPQAAEPGAPVDALHFARDSGRLTASRGPVPINAKKDYADLALQLPVYRLGMPLGTVYERRAAYLGSVRGGFNVETLLQDVLPTEKLLQLRLRLYDVGAVGEPARAGDQRRLLFDSSDIVRPAGHTAQLTNTSTFRHILTFEVGGRNWQLDFVTPKSEAIDTVDQVLPWAVFVGGIVSSVLLWAVLLSLASSRSRAEQLAGEMTRDLRASEETLEAAQRMAHLGNWSLDPTRQWMNLSAETYRILGISASTQAGLSLAAFVERIHPEDRAMVQHAISRATQSREHVEIEHRIVLSDQSVRWVHSIVQGGSDSLVPGTMMDITERKLAEQALLESRALLNDAQKLAQVGCCQYSPLDGRVIWSDELYRIHGIDRSTFTPSHAAAMKLVHPMDRAGWANTLTSALRTGEPFTADFRIMRPDGAVRHVRSLGEVIRDASGRPSRMLWSVIDISDQKKTEEALRASAAQLKALSRRLVEVQESERRQLSRELHDRVGQNLTALSINLDMLGTRLTGATHADDRARLHDSAALLEATVDSIENVMAELRPPMLDDYGLLPALHWYARDFTKRTGIEVSVQGEDGEERPETEIEIALFRIAQEALTNVAKHAQAQRAEIVLEHSAARCLMTISDDGIGLARLDEQEPERRPRLGFVTMRERAQAVGGNFLVRRTPSGGTEIVVSIS